MRQHVKKEMSASRGKSFCEKLNGTLVPAGDGFMCSYIEYQKGGQFIHTGENRIDIDQLTDEIVALQYRNTTKEEVEKIRQENPKLIVNH